MAPKTPELPQSVPVPKVHEQPAGNLPPARLGDVPLPEPRPAEIAPEARPIPEASPTPTAPENPAGARPAQPPSPKPAPPATGGAMPPDETACRDRLRALGVKFEERPPEADPVGCFLPHPVAIETLGRTVGLEPPALLNCTMAEAMSRFATDIVSPAARAEYGAELRTVSQASGYVCRPRNGTQTLSEHALGNALDIARFTLTDGMAIDVKPAPDAKAAKFLAAVRKAACGPFKTVLGPGSDPDHSLHLHLDLEKRRNGGTFCQ
jgi:hypothetical protein